MTIAITPLASTAPVTVGVPNDSDGADVSIGIAKPTPARSAIRMRKPPRATATA